MEGPLRPPDDPDFRLIETCLWTPSEGIRNRDLHLARLDRSAARLGIVPLDVADVLAGVSGATPQRLRLTVDRDGCAEVTLYPFEPLPNDTIWQMAISETRVRSDDPWLGVKTTRRKLYDEARAALPDGVDEMLFVNERGELCEGTITNIFVDLGQGVLTPPLRCGLLPGVLRQRLLAEGKVHEALLSPSDLSHAQSIHVGNSLRGLIRARIAAHPA